MKDLFYSCLWRQSKSYYQCLTISTELDIVELYQGEWTARLILWDFPNDTSYVRWCEKLLTINIQFVWHVVHLGGHVAELGNCFCFRIIHSMSIDELKHLTYVFFRNLFKTIFVEEKIVNTHIKRNSKSILISNCFSHNDIYHFYYLR